MHHCRYLEHLKYKIWAECANLSTALWNIQVQKNEVMSPHEIFFGHLPSYANHLHVFGQMGVVLDGTASTMKDKSLSKGVKKMFVGYSHYHSHDVYRMYNIETGRVSVTQDLRWLNELVGDINRPTNVLTDATGSDTFSGGDYHDSNRNHDDN